MSARSEKPWFKTVGVLGEKFPTKKALEDSVRRRIAAYTLNTPVSTSDFAFFVDLLCHHHEWAEKSTGGVTAVEVRMNQAGGFSTKGLWVVRTDNSAVDISWRTAIDGPKGDRQMLVDAARNAIVPQIEAARARSSGVCAICGGAIEGPAHIDHRPPLTFAALLDTWVTAQPRRALSVVDTGLTSAFSSDDTRDSWSSFHALFADLAATHPSCNMTQGGAV